MLSDGSFVCPATEKNLLPHDIYKVVVGDYHLTKGTDYQQLLIVCVEFTKEWPAHGETCAVLVESDVSACNLVSTLDHVKLFRSKTCGRKKLWQRKTSTKSVLLTAVVGSNGKYLNRRPIHTIHKLLNY